MGRFGSNFADYTFYFTKFTRPNIDPSRCCFSFWNSVKQTLVHVFDRKLHQSTDPFTINIYTFGQESMTRLDEQLPTN